MARVLTALALVVAAPASAAELTATPADYRARVAALAAGDVLTLTAGQYEGLVLRDLAGTPERPIELRGPASGAPAVIVGRACCATMSLARVAHLVVRDLVLDQRGELVDAIRCEAEAGPSHHVTLEGLTLRGFAQSLGVVGLETRCPAWDWTVRRLRVEGAGEGLLLGGADGRSPFLRGTLEQLLIVDPIGAAVVLEGHAARPAGAPTEDAVTVLRHSVLIKATRAGVGADARPTVRIGAGPTTGAGQGDRVELYGNLVFENASLTEPLVRAAGNVAAHDNLLVNTFGAAVAVTEPRAVALYTNTIYANGRAVAIAGASGDQRVVGNAVFSAATSPIQGGQAADNVVDTLGRAADYVIDARPVLGQLDLFPRSNDRLEGAPLSLAPFAAHLDADRDFNGTLKRGTTRGAYTGGPANPGWALAAEHKPLPIAPGRDAGAAPSADAGPSDASPIDAAGATDAPLDGGSTAPAEDAGHGGGDAAVDRPRLSRDGCACMEAPSGGAALALLALLGVGGVRRSRPGGARISRSPRAC